MTTSLKDVTSAQVTGKLADMDCFTKEYVVWAYGWEEAGRVRWRAGEDGRIVRQSYEGQLAAGLVVTPLEFRSTRAIISEENRADGLALLRLRAMASMQAEYTQPYFEALRTLRVRPSDGAAEALLREWQEELDGYFEEDALLLFEGAVRQAFLRGHLEHGHAMAMLAWSRRARALGGAGDVVVDQYSRTFCGCAFTQNGKSWQWLANANEETFLRQLQERLEAGGWHTPVWKKTLWFHRMNELPQVRKRFMELYRQVADVRYLERMATLEALPSRIPEALWADRLAAVREGLGEHAQAGFLRIARQLQLANDSGASLEADGS